MNIVLCDDNPVELEEIQKKVELYAAQTRQNIRVFPCRKSTVLSDELDQNHLADLYLLDIDMPKINGLQLAQKIHSIDRNLPVIFLTAYADYAPAAIKVQAFRYVSKADPDSGLTEALDSAIRTRERLCRYRSLVLKTEGACYCIPYDEICYAEKKGKHVEVHGIYRDFVCREEIKKLLQRLNDSRFAQIDRGCIVNLDFIGQYTNTAVQMTDGAELPISRRRLAAFKRAFAERWMMQEEGGNGKEEDEHESAD